MTNARAPAECWLIDMDGVLVHEGHALPGAADFLARLVERGRRFLVLTNNSIFTARDLSARLSHAGLQVPEESIWTSALATSAALVEPESTSMVSSPASMPATTSVSMRSPIMTVVSEWAWIRFMALRNIIGLGLPTK